MIPAPIGLSYLPYQLEGIEFAMNRRATLIADEMGLGKTIQAIGVMNAHPELYTVLIVCPASLRINWAREIDRWLISPCVDVLIVNYDILHKYEWGKKTFDLLIMDESHYLKNKSAKRSRLARTIKAKHRILLTGTPILNRPVELWHQLHILDPIAWPLKSYGQYTHRYCAAHRTRWGMDVSGASNLGELNERIKPLMIRRLKSEVLKDLPAKRRQIIELSTDGVSADLLDRMTAMDTEIEYAAKVKGLDEAMRVAFIDTATVRHEVALAKVHLAIEFIKEALESSEKVVVFAHHRDVLQELYDGLLDYNPTVVHGSVSQYHRQAAVDRFQNEDGCRVFIGQIQAAGVGITLTAASHVIFVELDWTPGMVSQAEDRCHRIGQKDSVLVQHLVLDGTLDAKIAKALIKKQSIIDRAIDARKEGE